MDCNLKREAVRSASALLRSANGLEGICLRSGELAHRAGLESYGDAAYGRYLASDFERQAEALVDEDLNGTFEPK